MTAFRCVGVRGFGREIRPSRIEADVGGSISQCYQVGASVSWRRNAGQARAGPRRYDGFFSRQTIAPGWQAMPGVEHAKLIRPRRDHGLSARAGACGRRRHTAQPFIHSMQSLL
jgi:hypothetical protein